MSIAQPPPAPPTNGQSETRHPRQRGRPRTETPAPQTVKNRRYLERKEAHELAIELGFPLHLQLGKEAADWARLLHYGATEFLLLPTAVAVCLPTGYWSRVSARQPDGLILLLHRCRELAATAAWQQLDEIHQLTGESGERHQGAAYQRVLTESYPHSWPYYQSLVVTAFVQVSRWYQAELADKLAQRKRQYHRLLQETVQQLPAERHETARTELAAHFAASPPPERDLQAASDADFQRGRWLATDDDQGRSIDLATGELVERDVVQRGRVWATPSRLPLAHYRPDFLTATPATAVPMREFCNQLGFGLLKRLAYHLRHTSKDIDCIRIPQSNAGKSTLIDALRRALPGLVWSDPESKSLTERGSRFSQATAPLTEYRLVCYDECDKIDEVKTGLLNSLTADELSIEKKGLDPQSMPRIGQPLLIGADWPAVDTSMQGVAERLPWAYQAHDLPVLSQGKRAAILHPDGLAWLATTLITAASQLVDGDDASDGASRAAAAELHAARADPLVLILCECLSYEPEAFTVTANIMEALVAGGIEKGDLPQGRTIQQLIRRVVPQARPGRRTVDGEQCRGWLHVALAELDAGE